MSEEQKVSWYTIAVIGLLLALCLLATYYFHFVLEIEILFTHLFYVPIILASLWWSRKGLAVAVFLALMLLVSHIISPLETPFRADVTRALMFVVVGTAVAILSEKRRILEDKLRAYSETLEQKVEERTTKLKDSEEKQRAILDGIGDAVIVLDNDLNITWANEITVNLYGAVIGRKCYEALRWLKEPCSDCIARKTCTNGVARTSEEEGILKDGTRINFIVSCSPVRDPEGKVVSVVDDITERKRAEEALRESEERFRTIVETAPSLLSITDIKGNNIYVSPNCEEITGYTQEELIGGMRWWVHEDDTPRAKEFFERTLREGVGGKNFEYKAVRKNGELWYAASSWEPLKDEKGMFRGVVFQTIDITDRKRAEEELKKTAILLQEHVEKLEEAKRQVEVACRLREYFLKETSHRIITPVAIIGGCVQLLLDSRNLDEDQKKKIRIMQARNKEVQKLVRDALAGKYLAEDAEGGG